MSDRKHTPTPWRLEDEHDFDRTYSVYAGDLEIMTDMKYEESAPDKNDAAFIVHAVNLHDELVSALKLVCDMYHRATGLPIPSQADRVLLKAREK